jgi:hypothetical protein
MRAAPSVEDYARMSLKARKIAAQLAQQQVDVLEQAATRRAEKQHARDTERDALYADAEKHRQRALARWHDGALLQRARLNEARAEMDQHTQNRTAA